MKKQNPQTEVEQTTIVIPANAIENIGVSQILNHIGSGLNSMGISHPLEAATAARNDSFPCLKRMSWREEVELRVVYPLAEMTSA